MWAPGLSFPISSIGGVLATLMLHPLLSLQNDVFVTIGDTIGIGLLVNDCLGGWSTCPLSQLSFLILLFHSFMYNNNNN